MLLLVHCASAELSAEESTLSSIQTLIRQSQLGEADKQLQAILQKQPANARALVLLGVVRRQQPSWPEAEALFRRAVAAAPRSVEACQSLGDLLRDEARWPEAAAQYEFCHKLVPANYNIASELAIVYAKNREYAKSSTLAARIPEINRPARLLPVIATNYLALGNTEKAEAAIAEVLRRAPADPDIVPALANSLLDNGMTKDAADLLAIAQVHQKMSPAFLAARAKVQAATGERQPAVQTIDGALKLEPKSQDSLATAAVLAIR